MSLLNKYIYILNYSCAHTLANKHNTSIKKIFFRSSSKKGFPISASITVKTFDIKKTINLMDYNACKELCETQRFKRDIERENQDDDFL